MAETVNRGLWVTVVCGLLAGACSSSGTAAVVSVADTGVDAPADLGPADVGADAPDGVLDAPALDAPMDGPGDAPADAPADVPFRCTVNGDCARDPAAPVCDAASGRCVGCLAAADTCPGARHCDDGSHTCVAGCHTDDACGGGPGDAGADGGADAGAGPSRHCDLTAHACVNCLVDDHCPAGMLCVGNTCTVGCLAAHACPAGQVCCAAACVDPAVNVADCGGCDVRCAVPNASAACMNGMCAVGACTAPWADCDGARTNGCEVNTLTDAAHCGGCATACGSRPHAGAACVAGACQYTCDAGYADCNGDPTDGCETDLQHDPTRCGACATACDPPHGTPACAAGRCAVAACEAGFADCDANPTNGCETDVRTNVSNCHACGTACPSRPHAFPGCLDGACVTSCVMGFQDCNGDPADGCEVDIRVTAASCGACGHACDPAHATGSCAMGTCGVAVCDAGFADCNLNPADGCEVNVLSDVANCSTCGHGCTAVGATAVCVAGACATGTCAPGRAHCSANPADGCEVNVTTDARNCGGCGTACDLANATAACAGGRCAVMACAAGFGDCNGSPADGCEANLGTDVRNCGGCGSVCAPANATGACASGRCGIAACNPGYADCNMNPADGCETNLGTDVRSCGGCGSVCAPANATGACASGRCLVAGCAAGWADCDMNPADGCEVNVAADPRNCGACGRGCALPNVTAAGCAGGACTVVACAAGFGDCNGNPADGCEANLATDHANCGACGVTPPETCNLRDDDCDGRCDDVAGCRVAVYRSTGRGEHFYTTSSAETGCCGFRTEGIGYYLDGAMQPGLLPFYRCIMDYGKHFYTTASNCEGLSPGHVEGTMGYISSTPVCGAVPLYRSFNGSNGDHFYTTSFPEHTATLAAGYRDEGLAGYVWTGPQG